MIKKNYTVPNDVEFCAGNSGKLRNRLRSRVENLKKSWGTKVAEGGVR